MKKVWVAVLTFSLAFFMVVSFRVLAYILATIVGGNVTVG